MRTGERSIARFGAKAVVISEIRRLEAESGRKGWDGGCAEPVSPEVTDRACDLIRVLPDSVPLPEVAAETDGSIGLDWIQSPVRVFSVSVGGSDRIAYAWIDGTDRGCGTTRFESGQVPSRIVDGIRAMVLGSGA